MSPDSLGCQDASLSVESYREEPHESVSSSMEMQSSHKKVATTSGSEWSQSESEYESADITDWKQGCNQVFKLGDQIRITECDGSSPEARETETITTISEI